MKNCQNIIVDLSAFADSELPAARAAEVQAHVDACPACRQALEELQQLAAGVAAAPRVAPDAQFLDDVRRKLREPEREATGWGRILFSPSWQMEAAVALLLVAGVWLFIHYGNRTREPEPAGNVAVESSPPAAVPVVVQAEPASARQARILTNETAEEHPAAPIVNAKPGDLAGSSAVVVVSDLSVPADHINQPPMAGNLTTVRPELPETFTVQGDSLVAVQLRAAKIAKALNGHFDSITPSNTLLVSVPRSKVNTFRSQISRNRSAVSYAYSPSADHPEVAATAAANQTNEPEVQVEVVVQPAVNRGGK